MSYRNDGSRPARGRRPMDLLLVATLAVAPSAWAQAPRLVAEDLSEQQQRFIVTYRDNRGAKQVSGKHANLLRRAADTVAGTGRRRLDLATVRVLATGDELVTANRPLDRAEAETLMRSLAADPAVERVQVDHLLQERAVPNDGMFSQLWALGTGPGAINVQPAWDEASGAGVVVAVVDSGITRHPDLDFNVLPGHDFISDPVRARDGDGRDANPTDEGTWRDSGECAVLDPRRDSTWHGTMMAGIVAAVANNKNGVAGTAFRAKVLPVRAIGRCGANESDAAEAIIWAAGGDVPGVPRNLHPAEVINLSIGSVNTCGPVMQKAINIAVEQGATVVAAAGNEARSAATSYPASCDNVVVVGATDERGGRWSSSNFGDKVTISAPGVGIFSTSNSGTKGPDKFTYNLGDGTSPSTAYVSGVVALMQSVAPKPMTPAIVRNVLQQTARPLPIACPEGCGAGIVDAAAAVAAARMGRFADGSPIEPR